MSHKNKPRISFAGRILNSLVEEKKYMENEMINCHTYLKYSKKKITVKLRGHFFFFFKLDSNVSVTS